MNPAVMPVRMSPVPPVAIPGLPVVFAQSDEEVLKIVEGNAGAVGVIDVYNITGGVKVLKIDDKQPFDPGYVLKGR